mmetsp:Transcript_23860/g.66822  ORF Transcript_23860/g.66822 Transcript_23860/m.66822 type:complete len:467 (+) Transcript_23860:92-1492(+)|eukprot:CAMPEP_0119151674 /NCGR_PEP_ID=MMETSP1310-20130426/46655_1 /TAXON_ID=464262 /ORGANISM="Genus nov. species nov., Strain RCC2339" /LENGTH=466 /DNA_ID=CAMNT_0007143971 /DNA_START=93 /DNA_END=1493 /DNA_ORIENTATION=-
MADHTGTKMEKAEVETSFPEKSSLSKSMTYLSVSPKGSRRSGEGGTPTLQQKKKKGFSLKNLWGRSSDNLTGRVSPRHSPGRPTSGTPPGSVRSYDELPRDVKKRVKKASVKEADLADSTNWEVFCNILRFLKVTKCVEYSYPRLRQSTDGGGGGAVSELEEASRDALPVLPKKLLLLGDPLGSGGYGSVYSALVDDGEVTSVALGAFKGQGRVAVKRMKCSSARRRQLAEDEVRFVAGLRHPCIVPYIGGFDVPGKEEVWLVVSYLDGGNLHETARHKGFSVDHMAYLSQHVLAGIEFLHNRGFIHRDVKSRNVMLTTRGDVKLIDFGLVTKAVPEGIRDIVGTAHYLPPEMLRLQPHSYPVDIWSFGIVLRELLMREDLTRCDPLGYCFQVATKGVADPAPSKLPSDARDAVLACLQLDPAMRPSAAELLKLPFFQRSCQKNALVHVIESCFVKNQLDDLGLQF